MRDDPFYVQHIVDCISQIEGYTVGGKAEFDASTLIQDTVLRKLQIMAESSQRLSDNLKAGHPEIEWREMRAFRNIRVHNYLGVNIDQTWELPPLKIQVQVMLNELGNDS